MPATRIRKAKVKPLVCREHPVVSSARRMIARHAQALKPPYLFTVAALAEEFATHRPTDYWWMVGENAKRDPSMFQPSLKRRAR